jgi:hypothetical protein
VQDTGAAVVTSVLGKIGYCRRSPRFVGDSKTERGLTEEHRALCFQCHTRRKDADFVFSEYRK